jgi:ATP-binding cassette subfamily B protein
VSLSIESGEIVALVGHNGAGKSTLAKLLAGLYAPTEGDILFDGHSISSLSLTHLQKQISFVHQRVPRFESTVEEFIAFGDWDRLENNPEEIRKISQEAGLEEMINALPNQYQTHLGRVLGECDLSGGQWQKMVQAQTMAANSPIIILDEPAASLDLMSEKAMHDRIRKLLHGRTTILISHRFSTVQMADRIIVLLDGQIAEEGTHTELINQQGVYSTMANIHQGFFENVERDKSDPTRSKEINRDFEAA